MQDLAGRIALVTGASSGIGRAVALALAAAGADLALCGRDEKALLEVTGLCIRSGAGSAQPAYFDVSNESECRHAVEQLSHELGAPSILVNSAGIAHVAKITETTLEQWRAVMAVDVEGPFLLSRSVLPAMRAAGRGTIINIGSSASRVGVARAAAYSAAKHALLGLTRALAAEYAPHGVTVNCVCPYYVDTPMTQAAIESVVARTGASREQATSRLLNPQGRLTSADEVAAMCLLLASAAGSGITGQAINVDGGHVQG